MNILIIGPPGCGKTSLINKLLPLLNNSEVNKFSVLNLSEFIKTHKLYDFYNKDLDTYEYSEKSIKTYLKKICKRTNNLLIESHSPSTFRGIKIDYIFYLQRPTKEILTVYNERKYSINKIQENLNCINLSNILDSCLEIFEEPIIIEMKSIDFAVYQIYAILFG